MCTRKPFTIVLILFLNFEHQLSNVGGGKLLSTKDITLCIFE
jgi:hypothetical protein